MIRNLISKVRGKHGQNKVGAVVKSFEKNIQTLDSAHSHLGSEIGANGTQQVRLQLRQTELLAERARAEKLRAKLADFIR